MTAAVAGGAGGPVLVLGGFPPVPGPVTAATVAAVRREVGGGVEVRTASVRPGGAELVGRVTGVLAGWRLEQLRRATGAQRLVIALDRGVPATGAAGATGRLVDLLSTRSLAWGVGRFATTEVLVATDPGAGARVMSPLWAVAATVVVDGSLGRSLGVPAAKVRRHDEPPRLRGLAAEGVTALGPPEVTPVAMPRYVLGVAGRRLLGRRFMPAYTLVLRTANLARRVVGRLRRSLARSPGR